MRVLIIPDTHGENEKWKKFVDEYMSVVHKVIFLGDYLDEFVLPNWKILENLNDVINLKKDNPEKVILLYGNHEYSYMDDRYRCSGFRPEIMYELYDLLRNNKDCFQNAYQYSKTIFTHAGIQEGWFKFRYKGDKAKNIAEQLNNPKDREQLEAFHDVGHLRGGYNAVGGPLWCDKNELKKPLQGFKQVVGHTPLKDTVKYRHKDAEVLFTDCLKEMKKPLILEIN